MARLSGQEWPSAFASALHSDRSWCPEGALQCRPVVPAAPCQGEAQASTPGLVAAFSAKHGAQPPRGQAMARLFRPACSLFSPGPDFER